jgi:uncharacterized protein (DUF885 family)
MAVRRIALAVLGGLAVLAAALAACDRVSVNLHQDPAEAPAATSMAASLAGEIARFPETRGSTSQADAQQRFQRLSQLYLAYTLREMPERAAWRGYPGHYDGWTDYSPAGEKRRHETAKALLAAVRSIDGPWFIGDEKVSYDLLLLRATLAADLADFPEEVLANQGFGPQLYVPLLLAKMPLATVEDGERYLTRLAAVPRLLEQLQGMFERHAGGGMRPVRSVLEKVPPQIDGLLAKPPAESPLIEPLEKLPASLPEAERRRLLAEGERLVRSEVAPAFTRYRLFLSERYLPMSRSGVAIAELPDGMPWYVARVRLETTSKLRPPEIHQLGLSEVARLRERMEEVKREAGFSGSLAEFFTFLQTDPRFFYGSADELLAGYRDIVRRAEAGLPALFGKRPGRPCRVEAIPDFAAMAAPPAFYDRGSDVFRVNTGALAAQPKWAMEALALHEGVPGHHLQLSLASALTGVPEWRKLDEYTAFFEGWAVYAESLGERLGFYRDPYSRFGEVASQMWRAVRLVVDTGLHTKGWSRQQAIDYFVDSVPLPRRTAESEIDRYISMPAQGLAYKVGELEIRRLRTHAEKELGDRFDLRAFHDRVLSRGAVPLDFLAADVEAWIRQEKANPRGVETLPVR